MLYFNFNGKTLPESTLITGPDNRGLRYGDGLFETMRYDAKQGLLLGQEHFERLWHGLSLMKFRLPALLTPSLLETETLQLIRKNNLQQARIRITITRGNGGIFDTNTSTDYLVQAWPLTATHTLNENGLQLCIHRDATKNSDAFSHLKHNNYLPYIMAAIEAIEKKCNDAIVLNNHSRIADTCIANIFLIKDQTIFTPALEEGCVAGIMRQYIIDSLKNSPWTIIEKPISEEELLNADEVFLTNSIYHVRWVAGIESKLYTNTTIQKIFRLLMQTNPAVFC